MAIRMCLDEVREGVQTGEYARRSIDCGLSATMDSVICQRLLGRGEMAANIGRSVLALRVYG